jgi:hypothetical protein
VERAGASESCDVRIVQPRWKVLGGWRGMLVVALVYICRSKPGLLTFFSS